MSEFAFVRGHLVYGVVRAFPHLCPGEGCAIARWLAEAFWRVLNGRTA